MVSGKIYLERNGVDKMGSLVQQVEHMNERVNKWLLKTKPDNTPYCITEKGIDGFYNTQCGIGVSKSLMKNHRCPLCNKILLFEDETTN